jgi:hypothetical protein
MKRLQHRHCHETNARLIEDTNLNQVTLVMKMEKGISRKLAENQQKNQQIKKTGKEWRY